MSDTKCGIANSFCGTGYIASLAKNPVSTDLTWIVNLFTLSRRGSHGNYEDLDIGPYGCIADINDCLG